MQFCAGELVSDSSNDACLSWLAHVPRAGSSVTWISCRMARVAHVPHRKNARFRALSRAASLGRPPASTRWGLGSLRPLAHVAHVLHIWGLDPLAHVAHVLHMGARPPGSRGSRAPPGARPPALCRRPSGDPKVQRRFCFRKGRGAPPVLGAAQGGERGCALDGHTPTTRRVRRGADTARATDPWGRTQGGGGGSKLAARKDMNVFFLETLGATWSTREPREPGGREPHRWSTSAT